MSSPTQRTLAELRKLGYLAAIVEKRNAVLAHVTHDLFGVVDVLAIAPAPVGDEGDDAFDLWRDDYPRDDRRHGSQSPIAHVLAIQATSGSNVAARIEKVRNARWPAPSKRNETGGELVLPRLIAAGWRVEVWGWRKSKKTRRWELRREVVSAQGAPPG